MKKFVCTLLGIYAFICTASAQLESQQIDQIEKIRMDIQNNIDKYQKTEIKNDTTGNKTIYKKNNEVKLITIDYRDGKDPAKISDKHDEWYYANAHLVYSEQTTIDIKTGFITDNQKFYLNEKNLVGWIKTDNMLVDNSSQEFKDIEVKLIAYGAKLLEEK